MSRSRIALVLALAAGACSGPAPRRPDPAPSVAAPLDRARLDRASVLARGRPITGDEWRRWSSAGTPVSSIVDELAADPFLVDAIAPALLFKHNGLRAARMVGSSPLDSAEIGGRTVFYIRKRCTARDVVSVSPWWALDTKVDICRDDIRPDRWETRMGGLTIQCDAIRAAHKFAPTSQCGCGPNLIRCSPPDHTAGLMADAMEELRATAAHVVRADQPLARLFTMNETVRRRQVELLYLRLEADGLRLANPEPLLRQADGWPAEGKLAPRHEAEPGQHAGVLTAPHLVYATFDPRQRMRVVYASMWCTGESAPGAAPEDVLSLHTSNLSTFNEAWQELAARPICTNCHARLDYGNQFFRGYPSPNAVSRHYLVGAVRGERGPLYGDDIRDRRGDAVLTPQGFAELATVQPEFARCMARNVAEYVFGPQVNADTIERLAESAPANQLRFGALIRDALVDLIQCDSCSAAPASPGAASFQALVDDHCTGCHHDGADVPSFEGPLDRQRRITLLDQVLFGRMPPSGPLARGERRRFLAAVYGDGANANARAERFLAGAADPPPALPLRAARELVRQLGGGTVELAPLNTLELAVDGRDNILSPNFAAITAVDVARSCAGATDRDACIRNGLAAVWGLPAP